MLFNLQSVLISYQQPTINLSSCIKVNNFSGKIRKLLMILKRRNSSTLLYSINRICLRNRHNTLTQNDSIKLFLATIPWSLPNRTNRSSKLMCTFHDTSTPPAKIPQTANFHTPPRTGTYFRANHNTPCGHSRSLSSRSPHHNEHSLTKRHSGFSRPSATRDERLKSCNYSPILLLRCSQAVSVDRNHRTARRDVLRSFAFTTRHRHSISHRPEKRPSAQWWLSIKLKLSNLPLYTTWAKSLPRTNLPHSV